MAIRVLLADDHAILREGLRILLQNQPGIEVLGVAENGRSSVALAKQLRPDVVIMDVTMPDMNGIEAARQILADARDTRVLALSMHSDKRFVARMLQTGASGYLLKDCAFEELTAAVRTVAGKQIYLSPRVTDVVVEDYKRHLRADPPNQGAILSPREREVLQLLAEGRPTRTIADLLHVSVKTVETHRKQIMDKLGLHSVAELTKYAVREGLTSLDR